MPMLITRYISKEILAAFLVVTLLLLAIFLSDRLVRYLNYVASGKVAVNTLFYLLGLEIPSLLTLLLPLGLFLSVLLALSRLYADNELRVLEVYGFSHWQLSRLVSFLSFVVMVWVAVFTLKVDPAIVAMKADLFTRGTDVSRALETMMPGRFQLTNDDKRVIYVERLLRGRKKASKVFIAEEKPISSEAEIPSWSVLFAEEGYLTKDHVSHEPYMVADQGVRYDGTPGENDYRIIQFKKYAVRVPPMTAEVKQLEQEGLPTRALWQTRANPKNAAELQWRLSIPLSVWLLALLAIPLSKIGPRQGRYTPLLPAILLYVAYVNLLFAARNGVEDGVLSLRWGMGWVHLGLVCLIIMLWLWQYRSYVLMLWRKHQGMQQALKGS